VELFLDIEHESVRRDVLFLCEVFECLTSLIADD
jgi:hypothetical protein